MERRTEEKRREERERMRTEQRRDRREDTWRDSEERTTCDTANKYQMLSNLGDRASTLLLEDAIHQCREARGAIFDIEFCFHESFVDDVETTVLCI